MAGGLKDGSNMKAATGCAEKSRTSKAGSFAGDKPPPGPKAVPVRTNGIKVPKEKGVSK